jgi:predicted component of type VI protein secretion system
MPESTQHKLDRIRPPRVQITYDVETRGSFVKMELPFVVGIMADLSTKGGAKDDQGNPIPIRDKKYLEVDRDNFNDVMASIKPSVGLDGKAVLNGGPKYTFESLEDFTPIRLLKPANAETNKVDPADANTPLGKARADYVRRTRLSDMVAKLDGNVPLQTKFLAALKTNDGQELKATMEAIKEAIKSEATPPPAAPPSPALTAALQAVKDAQTKVDEARTNLAATNKLAELEQQLTDANASLETVKKSAEDAAQKQIADAQQRAKEAQDQLDQAKKNAGGEKL